MNKNIAQLKNIRNVEKNKLNVDSQIAKETLLLASGENSEEYGILRSIGLDTHFRKEIAKQSKENEITMTEEKFKRNTFKGSDIKAVCYKYGLDVQLARNYKGPVSLDIARAILKLTKENEVKHQRHAEAEIITKSEVNLSETAFYILTDDFNKGKSVTLFYAPNRSSTSSYGYEQLSDDDIVIEVASFGEPFSEFRQLCQLGYSSHIGHLAWLVFMAVPIISSVFTVPFMEYLILTLGVFAMICALFISDDYDFEQIYYKRK